MSSTTCFQKTSNSCTSSGTPRNLRTGEPSLSFPFPNFSSMFELGVVGKTSDFSDSEKVVVAGDVGTPQAFASGPAEVGEAARCAFSRALSFCSFTLSARRRAAASSWRFVSSGSSLSASRAAYDASRSIRAMTICLILTLG